jgi:hypothetical protein
MITVKDILQSDNPFELSEEGLGLCPCCSFKGDDFEAEVLCWREGGGQSIVTVTGNLPYEQKEKIAEHIRDNNPWSLSSDWRIEIKNLSEKKKKEIRKKAVTVLELARTLGTLDRQDPAAIMIELAEDILKLTSD